MSSLKVGCFPYEPGQNPYQRLFAESLERSGISVNRISPRKYLPLRFAASHDIDLLQLDWPHDWYQGRNAWSQAVKRLMYWDGLRRIRRTPVVWTAHNLRAHDARDDEYEHRMIQALIDVCDGIIVLSGVSGELLRSEYKVPTGTIVEVVQHGHYIGVYPNSISRQAARAALGIAGDARVVLSLGRLQPYKGLEELLEAFCRTATPGDVLLLAGQAVSPAYSAQLRQAIGLLVRPDVRVELRDVAVPDQDLQVYFNACDVVALPFRQVLNSGSLLLAMSFGCPIVAPRLGSIPEVACPEGWFGYDPTNAGGLGAALGAALATPGLATLRRPILEFTSAHYDWDAVGAKAAALYAAIHDRVTPNAKPGMRH
jgi:beta-1,4-mannosyltransferase